MKTVLMNLIIKDSEKYPYYFNLMLEDLEKNLKNYKINNFIFTSNNNDKTLENLKKYNKFNIYNDGDNFKEEKDLTNRLTLIRKKNLDLIREKNNDYNFLIDSDIFFSPNHIENMINLMEEKKINILSPNTLRFPTINYYDTFSYIGENNNKDFYEVESAYGGLLLISKEILKDKTNNYINGDKECFGCEHKIFMRNCKKNNYKIFFAKNINPIYGNDKFLGNFHYPFINNMKDNYKNIIIFLFFSLLLICIGGIYLIYKNLIKYKMNKIFYLLISIPIIFLTIEIFMNLTRRTTINWEDEKVREVIKRNNNFILPDIKEEATISKNILQTYKSLDKIPNYVFDNLKNKNKNYKYYFYNDQQCEEYIQKEYGNKILEKYQSIKRGAHKADIFRLCWLYKNGGVYCDIDTHILLDLDNLIDKIKGDNISIPITHDKQDRKRLLNCMIIVNKGNPLIKKCLENILKTKPEEINKKCYYHLYLLIMQVTLGNKVNYHFIESNDGDSFSFLLTGNKWSIKDKYNNIIAYSRYPNYDHQKGFKKN